MYPIEVLISKFNNLLYKNKVINDINKKNKKEQSVKLIEYNQNRKYGFDKNFCYAPTTSLYFKYNGDVIACCKNNLDIYGNVSSQTLDEIWSSAQREQLKASVKNYKQNKGCDFCFRQLENKNYSGVHAMLYDNHYNRYIRHDYPTEVTFEISNKCNLECIMCDGYRSSSIRKNREKLPERPDFYPDNFLEQLVPFIPNFRVVRLQGGEPFLIPFYLDLIEKIGELNKRCKIYIQTNGTILSDRIRKIVANKQIELSISIDAFNKIDYEYIRKNGVFEKTIKNLLEFNEIARKQNKKLNINYCILKNNVLKIHEAIDFCTKNKMDLQFIIIDNPASLSIFYLNEDEAREINLYLDSCIGNHTGYTDILNDIKNCLNYNFIQEHSHLTTEKLYMLLFENLKLYIPDEIFDLKELKSKIDTRIKGEHEKHLLLSLLFDTSNLLKSYSISGIGLDEYLSVFLSRKDILLKLKA